MKNSLGSPSKASPAFDLEEAKKLNEKVVEEGPKR